MGRSNTGSTANDLTSATTPVVGYPATLACWANLADATTFYELFGASQGGGNYFVLAARGDASAVVSANLGYNSGEVFANSTASYKANTWFHAAAVFAGATDRRAFLNGGYKGTDVTNHTPSANLNKVTIG